MVSSVTIEEAVALLINLDYIPTGFTLLDMTAAFLEEAEVNHHNATVNHLPASEIAALQIRMDACAARHSLAQSLTSALRNEIGNPDSVIVALNDNSSIDPQLTVESVSIWASNFGIGFLAWVLANNDNDKTDAKDIRWEDVTIKIYKNYRIAYFSGTNGQKGKVVRFQDIGLMGTRKNKPNDLGSLFITLSKKKKFPEGKNSLPSDKTAISKLRNSLKQLTGLSSDPFSPFNKAEGYKPRFTLIDDRRNADERAKKRAVHLPINDNQDNASENDEAPDYEDEYAEAPDFNDENDAGGKWLKKNE